MLITSRNQDLMPMMIDELMNWNRNMRTNESTAMMPKMNVSETETEYEVELCVPGLKKEDLSLNLDSDNNLVIQVVKTEEKSENDKKRKLHRREFGTMHFSQTLALPENVKKEAIEAKVEDGILTITLPKLSEDEKKSLLRMIEIR